MNDLTDRELDAQIAERVMGLVPCQGNGHANGELLPCHAQPESPTQGAETRLYSTDISAAIEVRDRVGSMTFSARRRFKRELQRIISERVGVQIHTEEIILKFTARDICLAALAAVEGE